MTYAMNHIEALHPEAKICQDSECKGPNRRPKISESFAWTEMSG